MVHFKRITAMLVIILSNYYLIAGTYSGGSGTLVDPYLISTAEDLIELSQTTSDWYPTAKYFIQTANIYFNDDEQLVDWDGDGSATWDTQDQWGFPRIGNSSAAFRGHYDGQNHTITNLYINMAGVSDRVALFGYAYGSNIQNIGLINVSISGNNDVAALVGQAYNGVQVTNCFSTGSVTGVVNIGGLIGSASTNGSISNSYSTASVTASGIRAGGLVGMISTADLNVSYCFSTGTVTSNSNMVGGFIGLSAAIINNCYSLGNVVRSSGTNTYYGGFCGMLANAGSQIINSYSTGSVNFGTDKGFIGYHGGGTFSNNFFDSQTSSQSSGAGATATTTANMKTQTTFTNATWDFGTDNTDWVMSSSITYARYPTFRWTGGYSDEPSLNQIANLPNLVWVAENSSRWSSSYMQVANIFTWTTPSWDGNQGWTPIGNEINKFTNIYNGLGRYISNLYINRFSTNYIGFFGYTSGSTIENIGLVNNYMIGSNFIGGLIGYSYLSTIHYTFSTGFISGSTMVGGLLGSNDNSSVLSNSYSLGYVKGSSVYIGGLLGLNSESSVTNCYTACSVLTGGAIKGGFVGYYINSTFNANYWLEDINLDDTGLGDHANITETTNENMKLQATFVGWNFTSPDIWDIQSGDWKSYPYLHGLVYDAVDNTNERNPIPGLEEITCQSTVYVDASYTDQTSGWGTTHFADLSFGLAGVCPSGTVNIATVSNTSYSGDVDFSGLTVIVGDYDFELTGNITDGEVQVTNLGSLIMKDLASNTTKSFPITDGTYNYTMTVTTDDNSSPDISVRISDLNPPGYINNDFWDIFGPEDLDATVTLRVDKAAIAPKTLNSNTQVRYYDGTKYTPVDGNNFSIEEFDTYYIITITGVDEF